MSARRVVALAALACAACKYSPETKPGTSAAPLTVAQLTRVLDSVVDAPLWRNAHWGILVVDADARDTLYSHNAGKLFMPASNQKLLTGATALTQLGPDYRFTTQFAATGPIRDGTLDGDLVIVPSGDPTFSDFFWGGDAQNAFRAMAESLSAHGVRRVAGTVVRGSIPFPDDPCGYGWELDDLDEPYGACVQDLFVNEGFKRVPRNRTPGDTVMNLRAIRDPRGAFFDGLTAAMTAKWMVTGTPIDPDSVNATSARTPIFEMRSPPLAAIMARMMKPSQNQLAELLFKTVAREKTGVGTADSGRRVVERQLLSWGVDSTDLSVRDGSGMSRHDYVTPRMIARVLDVMRRAPTFTTWYDALPIAGVDGTIASRMRGTPAQGNVHAKTGSVDKARSLSGYVTTADGRTLIFSFLCNNYTATNRDVERVHDSVLALLAGHARPSR